LGVFCVLERVPSARRRCEDAVGWDCAPEWQFFSPQGFPCRT
jgi:hypothetical protein